MSRGSGSGSLVDMKTLGRPGSFHGKSTEWKDWAFGFLSFCTAVSVYMGERMSSYAKLLEGTARVDLSAVDAKVTVQLGYMLILSCKDKAVEKLRNFPDPQHGLESWRRLVQEYEPASAGRFGGMLVGILATKFKGTGSEELDTWEADIKRYSDSSSEVISNSIKIATVINGLTDGPLLQHLQLNYANITDYAALRAMIQNYVQARKTWTPAGTAMDLSALEKKEKGPGKGKGKGKKNKGKDGTDATKKKGEGGKETRECFYCKKPGHLKQDCRRFKADQEKEKKGDLKTLQAQPATTLSSASTPSTQTNLAIQDGKIITVLASDGNWVF
jgi:hypothetical protein